MRVHPCHSTHAPEPACTRFRMHHSARAPDSACTRAHMHHSARAPEPTCTRAHMPQCQCGSMRVTVEGQLAVISLLLPCGFRDQTQVSPSWQQAPFPAAPSHWRPVVNFSSATTFLSQKQEKYRYMAIEANKRWTIAGGDMLLTLFIWILKYIVNQERGWKDVLK